MVYTIENINELKAQIKELEELYDSKCNQVIDLGNRIAAMQMIIDDKDDQIETLRYGSDYPLP